MCGGVIPHYSSLGLNQEIFTVVVCEEGVSHLFFADDSVLSFKATKKEARVVKDLLKVYENASSQAVW